MKIEREVEDGGREDDDRVSEDEDGGRQTR
jgi:hypothetical protein